MHAWPQCIGDIVIGSVMGPSSQRATEVRMASLLTGIPETVPCYTVNRLVITLLLLLEVAFRRSAPFAMLIRAQSCTASWSSGIILHHPVAGRDVPLVHPSACP